MNFFYFLLFLGHFLENLLEKFKFEQLIVVVDNFKTSHQKNQTNIKRKNPMEKNLSQIEKILESSKKKKFGKKKKEISKKLRRLNGFLVSSQKKELFTTLTNIFKNDNKITIVQAEGEADVYIGKKIKRDEIVISNGIYFFFSLFF